jgi:hypothetical protein
MVHQDSVPSVRVGLALGIYFLRVVWGDRRSHELVILSEAKDLLYF